MTELIHIEMIQEDIDLGDKSAIGCPIARALRRTIGISSVYVDRTHVAFGSVYSGTRYSLYNPWAMSQWIKDYDAGIHYPRPLVEFDIDVDNRKIINYKEKI